MHHSPIRILLVDDDEADRKQVKRALTQPGLTCELSETSNIDAALAACESQSFDCAIIDYRMPGHDGLYGVAALKSRLPYMAVIMSTGEGDELVAAEAMKRGASDYIPKSRINPDSMRRIVINVLEKAALQRKLAEQKDELEHFTYALAHDFKQPIRQIKTFASLISGSANESVSVELNGHLSFLMDAATRLGNLVDGMAEYALLDQPTTIGEIDLSKVLNNVRSSIALYIEERNGTLKIGSMATVSGNEALMTQTLQNLVVNGLKYNKSEAPTVEVSSVAHDGQAIITVKDNGIGISANSLEEVFKPLVRLNAHSDYSGSGLGLTLARKAVTSQNGTIWCESTPGVGTEFKIRIPQQSKSMVSAIG